MLHFNLVTYTDPVSDDEIHSPSALVEFVTDPATTICDNLDAVEWSHQVSFQVDDISLAATAFATADGELCFSAGRWMFAEATCHCDWKFLAPEL